MYIITNNIKNFTMFYVIYVLCFAEKLRCAAEKRSENTNYYGLKPWYALLIHFLISFLYLNWKEI